MTRTNELLAAFSSRPTKTNARTLVAHLRRCLRAQLSLNEAQNATVRQALARLTPPST